MCGIVGYVGKGQRNVVRVIMDGLKKLEYRGYDSAGIVVSDGQSEVCRRSEGELINLEKKVESIDLNALYGIGHTRWATHGWPSESNSHPHRSGGVYIVHNGTIENSDALKKELTLLGYEFESKTDTEVVAHLINYHLKSTGNLKEAILQVVPRLVGGYAILALANSEPNTIVAFNKGGALLVGFGDKEMIIASDPQPIVNLTREIYRLKDEELAVITKDKCELFDFKNKPLANQRQTLSWDYERAATLEGFPDYTFKEISEQQRIVARIIKPYIDLETLNISIPQLPEEIFRKFRRIIILACGTSYYAGKVAEYLIEKYAGIPVAVHFGSEFRYRDPILEPETLAVVISQSGETEDTYQAMQVVKRNNIPVLSICNTQGSKIDVLADFHLYMSAGKEIGVASTKAFVATLTLFNLFTAFLGKIHGKITSEGEKVIARELLNLPEKIGRIMSSAEAYKKISKEVAEYSNHLFLARDVNYPVALEGALKFKELTGKPAEGDPAGEMKHGPLAMVNERVAVIILLPEDELLSPKVILSVNEIIARKGKVILVTQISDIAIADGCQHVFQVPIASKMVTPILMVVPLQLLAYYATIALGKNVDKPRNLAKSVTVE